MDPEVETLADDDELGDDAGEADKLEAEAQAELLRDRLRLAVIKITTSEGKKAGMEVADPVVACIADLAFKSAEQLAKDVELFAQHAGRKSIRMDDVILTAHRNEHLMGQLRNYSQELKGKEPCTGRKRKKSSKKDDKRTARSASDRSGWFAPCPRAIGLLVDVWCLTRVYSGNNSQPALARPCATDQMTYSRPEASNCVECGVRPYVCSDTTACTRAEAKRKNLCKMIHSHEMMR